MPPEEADSLDESRRRRCRLRHDAGAGGVDLDVRPGRAVLLLGANGAGKTTFLKSLVGLIEARRRQPQLADTDITRMRSSAG